MTQRWKAAEADHRARTVEGQMRPTKERERLSPMSDAPTEVAGVTAKQALIECVLDRYKDRAQISDRQHEAGLRFRSAFRRAALPQSSTGSYGMARGHGTSDYDGHGALRRLMIGAGLGEHSATLEPIICTRTRERFDALELPVCLHAKGHVAVAVCGLDEWAGGARRLALLREALGDLADYWGLDD